MITITVPKKWIKIAIDCIYHRMKEWSWEAEHGRMTSSLRVREHYNKHLGAAMGLEKALHEESHPKR